MAKNRVRSLRKKKGFSKNKLARNAGLSTLTIKRIEKGCKCKSETMMKILRALGLSFEDKYRVFKSH